MAGSEVTRLFDSSRIVASSALGVIAAVWVGLMAADNRWARAAEVAQKFQTLDRSFKKGEYQGLRREQVECDKTAKVRKLTKLEEDRCVEVREDVDELKEQLKKK